MSSKPLFLAASILLFSLAATSTHAAFVNQGAKLVGTGGVGSSQQGIAVSVSADGNTAIVGGYLDDGSAGAAWAFTRSAGVWSQQGPKLVGTGAVGNAQQGIAVSLSADGNTAIVGGYTDDGSAGAAWVFTRNAGVWSQQGAKLVGTGAVGSAWQGGAVALSADGNTALVGGNKDNSDAGAGWVYTRSAGVWTQQGAKLVGTGSTGIARQGVSVALSADGNTAVMGGFRDDSFVGAVWVFTRSAGVWSQQGTKLVGSGGVGSQAQGTSSFLSADGNTAVVGGSSDDGFIGAAWVFTRNAGVWSQQGSKLVGTGGVGTSLQGVGVSVSADGNTAIVGGYRDDGFVGAAWVYVRDGGVWSQQGSKLVGPDEVGNGLLGFSVSMSGDGETALVGGPDDDGGVGAVWAFVPSSPLPAIDARGSLWIGALMLATGAFLLIRRRKRAFA